MYKVQDKRRQEDNAIRTKNYAIVQNIIIQRENLQSSFFSDYSEKKHHVGIRSEELFVFNEVNFDHLQFIHCNYKLKDQEHLCIDVENEVLEMHFCLSGLSNVVRKDKSLELSTGNNMLTFQNNQQQEVKMFPNEKGRFYEIRIGATHFDKLMSDFYTSESESFAGFPQMITPEMYAVVAQLTNTTYSGKMKALFLEAKMMELFLLQLQQTKKCSSAKLVSLKHSDKDKIYDARQLIEQHIDEFITIDKLSRMTGINQRKLMQGFKELFGCTVYQYISNLKMQTAKRFLIEGNKNVNEVAYEIGYQNPQHFISAFKKKFGISPGTLKR